jgi:predicted RNase H-like HicB family nuclease
VSIQKEDKFYVARCPELGVTSQGKNIEEAQANIKEAIELYIESFEEDLPREISKPLWETLCFAISSRIFVTNWVGTSIAVIFLFLKAFSSSAMASSSVCYS